MRPSYAYACAPSLEMLYIVVLTVYSHFERGDMPKTATANCQRFGRIAHAVIILCACVARSLRASVDGDPRPRFYLLYINFYLYLHTSICEIILFLVRVLAFGPPLICRPFSFSDFQITVIVLPPLPGLALCLLSWCWLCASSLFCGGAFAASADH